MKKTLFAMAALALCGTAFATDYYLDSPEGYFSLYDGDTLHVNTTKNLDGIYAVVEDPNPVTFKFYGVNTISVTGSDGITILTYSPYCNITGDDAAMTNWATALTSSTGELKSVVLMNATDEFYGLPGGNETFAFDGHAEAGPITLGSASVQYIGSAHYTSMEALNDVLGNNQIALAFICEGVYEGPGQLVLAGKISGSPATPEPATATLSLLALAGLATRRRRK